MSSFLNIITKKVQKKLRKKNAEKGRFSTERFECASTGFTPIFVIGGLIFAAIAVLFVIYYGPKSENGKAGIYLFGPIALLILFGGWVAAHQKLIVDGNDATYVNVWGIKKRFQFSDLTKCLTTEHFLRLYIGRRKVATLDKDMYGIKFLEARCKKDRIEWRNKSRAGITKFTLVWNATSTFMWICFWTMVGIPILTIPMKIASDEFTFSDIVYILQVDLILAGVFGFFIILMMLNLAIKLKEVKSIEETLGISFREEMAKRGAIGREYQDEEWFVEAIPGIIEVLNRRFIKQWHGIKGNSAEGTKIYQIEFTDICSKRRKIGGHYKEHAEKMDAWYRNGK